MNQLPGTGSTPLDALYVDYCRFFEGLGCRLHYVSNYTDDPGELLARLPIDAVILSGGNDLSAEFIGEVEQDIRNPSPARDAVEKNLLTAAIGRNLPVLGICRGMQFINSYFGGGLTQDIETELPAAGGHIRTEHEISIGDPATIDWLGADTFTVNSFHHQGVQLHQVSPELEVFALSKADRIVEGLFHRDKPVAGIQWHPERTGNSRRENADLVRAFLERRGFWEERHP